MVPNRQQRRHPSRHQPVPSTVSVDGLGITVENRLLPPLPGMPDGGAVVIGWLSGGTPAHDFLLSLVDLMDYDFRTSRWLCREGGGRIGIETSPRVAEGRTQLVEHFLTRPEFAKADWLLMLDDDMSFDADLLERLMAVADYPERPIIGGLCIAGRHYGKQWPTIYEMYQDDDGTNWGVRPVLEFPENALVKCGGTGAACLLVHRQVYLGMAAAPWNTHLVDGRRNPYPWFVEGLVTHDGVPLGEDIAFPVAPNTAVLAGDWQWRPIESFGVGDSVLAFDELSPRHSSRRYQRAVVTGIVERYLPRLRVVTDEREVITTAEHPWLAQVVPNDKLAWRWTPTAQLEIGSVVASVMPRVDNPDLTSPEYAAGYFYGIMHSDGCRSVRGKYIDYRVVMKDTEPIERFSTMVALLGVESTRGPARWDGNPKHAPMHRISISRLAAQSVLEPIWHLDRIPSPIFAAGYLAGAYDGDGSHNGGRMSIHREDPQRQNRMMDAARLLGVPFTGGGRRSIWIDGNEKIFRFWQSTLPSLSRRTAPTGQRANDLGTGRGKEVRHRPEVVRAVEVLPVGDVRCLMTSTGTFIADGLGSHNCRKAVKCGIPIHVHTGARLGHVKSAPLTVATFRGQMAESSEAIGRKLGSGEFELVADDAACPSPSVDE